MIERWDPARDAWEVVLVNEPVERRVYRFVALDVVETPDGARLWAFDRANDVRVATVPAGPLARPVAFTTALTDTTLRQAVGLRFGATDVRLIATAEHAYLVYDARTIVEVARQGAPRLLRFGSEGRDEVLDANDIYWDTIVLREPITRLALAGGRPLVSQAGRLFEVVPGGAPVEWTVEGLPSPSWSIGDAVLDEGDTSYLLLDAWLVRCAERRCVDAGTRGAIAFDRLDRAAPGVLAAFREGSTAYGLVTEPR
ncbi:MAG: hypothetical protein M5U28_22265 [Sandaracinaceae bacterium]|nr:hypothetical protein [Sandaracinaceae bacterium]